MDKLGWLEIEIVGVEVGCSAAVGVAEINSGPACWWVLILRETLSGLLDDA